MRKENTKGGNGAEMEGGRLCSYKDVSFAAPIVVYFHGWRGFSRENGACEIVVSEKGKKLEDYYLKIGGEVICPQLEYEKSGQNIEKMLCEVERHLKGCELDRVVFVGTSLGGYIAFRAQEKFGCPSVIINPSCKPMETVGVDFPEIRREEVLHCKSPRVVLLAKDDDVIDPEIAGRIFEKGAQIEWFEGLGHRFSNMEIVIRYIDEIYNQSIHLP